MTRILTIVFAALSTVSQAGEGWYPSFEAAEDAAISRGLPLLIHFHASWCGPCRQMEAQVLSTSQVQGRLRNGIVAVEVDVSQHPDIAQQYGATTVPRDVVVEPGKSYRTLNVGFKSVSAYTALLDGISRKEKVISNARIIGLDGFCPVALIKDRKWITGQDRLTDSYRGITYHFSTEKARQTFLDNPRKYSPQNLGCDPVSMNTSDRAIAGKIQYGAFFDSKLYLFETDDNRKAFKSTPLKYTRTQHAINVNDLTGQRFN